MLLVRCCRMPGRSARHLQLQRLDLRDARLPPSSAAARRWIHERAGNERSEGRAEGAWRGRRRKDPPLGESVAILRGQGEPSAPGDGPHGRRERDGAYRRAREGEETDGELSSHG